jgi:hypothetical protein
MSKLADNLQEIHFDNNKHLYVKDWRDQLPAGSLWEPGSHGDPACKTCMGTGWVRADVYPGHPLFGKLQPCECVPNLIHQKLAMENSPAYIPTPLTKPAH